MSDAMFFLSVRDKKFTKTEIQFLKLGSGMVWAGLLILFLSGIGLLSLAPDKYMASSKFIAKMIIVAVIVINGAIMHVYQLPMIIKTADKKFQLSKKFMERRSHLLIGGAVSITSWSFALILGTLRGIPYSVTMIMTVYIAVVFIAILTALGLKKYIFGK